MFLFLISFTIRQQFLIIAPVIMGGREISRPYQGISFFYGWGKEKWDKEGGSKDFFVNLLFKYDGRRI